MKRFFRILLRVVLVLVMIPVTVLLVIFLNYHIIALSVNNRIYNSSEDIAYRKYTLVMGAGNYKPDLWINHTFNHRIYTTAELIKQHKTSKIIASGVRMSDELDEVSDMKQVLI